MAAPELGPTTRRPLGSTGLEVAALGIGCAPLGNLFSRVTDAEATATVQAALKAGLDLFDTAPLYGSGLSEARLGIGLAGRNAVVATKVGRLLSDEVQPDPIFVDVPPLGPVFDFSAEGVRRSLEASLERLRRDRVDIAWVHDPDDHEAAATTQALPELARLRDEGRVGVVGAGMNQAAMLTRFVEAGLVDAVLIAGRWSLLDHGALDRLLPACERTGTGVVVGGVFNSGLLAEPWANDATFDYQFAPADLVDRARRMATVCERYRVPLTAAAIRFPFGHPAVSAVVIGARSANEVRANVAAFATPVPEELWNALRDERLLPAHVPTP